MMGEIVMWIVLVLIGAALCFDPFAAVDWSDMDRHTDSLREEEER